MLTYWVCYHLHQRVDSNHIRQEEIGYRERNCQEDHVLRRFLEEFIGRHGRFIKLLLLICIPFNPVFDLSEYQFHKYSLGTGPAAPHPTINHCKQNNENQKYEHAEHEDVQVLRPENHAEDDKFTFENIKEKELLAIDLDKWHCDEDSQKRIAKPVTILQKSPCRLSGIYRPLIFRFKSPV